MRPKYYATADKLHGYKF